MTGDSVLEIAKLAKANILDIDDKKYTDKKVFPVLEPVPDVIPLHTLTGIVDYIKDDLGDACDPDSVFIHVANYDTVQLLSKNFGDFTQRAVLVDAKLMDIEINLGRWMDIENFNIHLMSNFVPNEGLAAVLKYAGNLTESEIQTYQDDGVTQGATVRTGVAKVETAPVPNPVSLCPYRTFVEIEQPASDFVFRLRKGPQAALFEADGGAWKNSAILSIKEWLAGELPDYSIIA